MLSRYLQNPSLNAVLSSPYWNRLMCGVLIALGLAFIWSGPYLPLIDMPQNASQIAGVRDMIRGDFRWYDLAEFNPFTPYLIGHLPAAVLALVMPVHVAMALLLSLSFVLFVHACIVLGRRFQVDPAFYYLYIISYFGCAFFWGFFTFLMAMPVIVYFVLFALDYAREPTLRRGGLLMLIGGLMFFVHAYAYVFSGFMGGWLLLCSQWRRPARLVLAMLPYIAMAAWLMVHTLLISGANKEGVALFVHDGLFIRIYSLFYLLSGVVRSSTYVPEIVTVLLLLAGTLMLTTNSSREHPQMWHLASGFLLLWLMLPLTAFGMVYIYVRFAAFLIPFFSVLFVFRRWVGPDIRHGILPLICALILACNLRLALEFHSEVQDYAKVTTNLEDGQRALGLVFNPDGPVGLRQVYMHMPAWYQAEKHGWVDATFAITHPVLVRYYPDKIPHLPPGIEWKPQKFVFAKHEGYLFRYFIIRKKPEQTEQEIAGIFTEPECKVELIASSGLWRVFERMVECGPTQPDGN